MTGADLIAARLVALDVGHVFGVGGANIEDTFRAIQKRRPQLRAILNKHEHSAGTAADAYSRIKGTLGVVMTTSGGGSMNLVPALAESFASHVPVLAIVGEAPTNLQGRGAFQDTSGLGGTIDMRAVFRNVSAWCERATRPGDLGILLEDAARSAMEQRAPAVLLAAKDLQQAPVADGARPEVRTSPVRAAESPDPGAIQAAARLLASGPVVIIAGDEVSRANAQADLERLAAALDARVAVAPDARDAFDNRHTRFAGVSGAMGHAGVADALAHAHACLVVGTRLPLLARQGHEAALGSLPLVSIGRDRPFVSSQESMHLEGDLVANLRALARVCLDSNFPSEDPAAARPAEQEDESFFGSAEVLKLVERSLPDDSVVLVDAGSTGAHAVHFVRAPRGGRWLVAMGMAGMGYTFGAAIGAAFATGRRIVVLAGDGAFFMHGLEIHTAVQHQLPITYVIFNNRAHGMCLVRERLLLGEESGYNTFADSHIGAGLAAMLPGLAASDCDSCAGLEASLSSAARLNGPSLVCAELPVEVPPFAAFQAALAARREAAAPPART